jgi:Bifunctional DNA primase/polymerase, N-terminal
VSGSGRGQPAKHPLGGLVPHGVKDATTNRAWVLAWWTRHPQANIGLATGHTFDVLDVDGPQGDQAIRDLAATHGLQSSGPLVRTGGGGWHFYLAPTGLGNVRPLDLAHVDWRGQGGYVVAPPSRHASAHPYQWAPGRNLDVSPGEVPAVLLERLRPRQLQRPPGPVLLPAAGDGAGGRYARARPWPRSWSGSPPPRSATATASCGSRPATSTTWSPPAPSTTTRSTKNSWRQPNAAGCLVRNPARPAEPWPPAAKSAWPTPAAHDSPPAPNAPTPRRPRPPDRPANEPRRGGEGHGRRRPVGRPVLIRGVDACRRQAEPAPTHHPQEGDPGWAATPP